jgi:hypothetical protein
MAIGRVRRDFLRIAAVTGAGVPLAALAGIEPAAAARPADDAATGRPRDIEAIKQLKARYCRTLDLRLWEEFAAVWTADAQLEVPELGSVIEGREAIVAFVRASLGPFESVHHVHMPEITITGAHTAHGVWAMSGLIAVPGTNPVRGFQNYGYYVEDYREGAGRWRISRSRLNQLRRDPLPGGFPGTG